jgi:lipocalin
LGLVSLILYFSPCYNYTLIGLPNRSNFWLLTKCDPNNYDKAEVKHILDRAKVLGFDMKKVVSVEHVTGSPQASDVTSGEEASESDAK